MLLYGVLLYCRCGLTCWYREQVASSGSTAEYSDAACSHLYRQVS